MIRCAAYWLCALMFLMAGCVGGRAVTAPHPDDGTQKNMYSVDTVSQAVAVTADTLSAELKGLSAASQLLIRACDNYLATNGSELKADTVLNIKASVYYNSKKYELCRVISRKLIETLPGSRMVPEATRMVAQSFYEEGNFDQAQNWFRKLKDVAQSGGDKEEATNRITEAIFKMAEKLSSEEKYADAAAQFERVALEFPDSKIADVALYNAGWTYEKMIQWSHSILVYQRLVKNYPASRLQAKAQFQTAKCYEKLSQWDEAADAYLRVVAKNPSTEEVSAALFNAANCFENGNRLAEAATTFEKIATKFPDAPDAADVLFRSGEIFGKIKDWESVSRVNEIFYRRYGSDQNRLVQALCMRGVALYMQGKIPDAIVQLQVTVDNFGKLKTPSSVNKYYAAKAEYTLAEINHEAMNSIALRQPQALYKQQVKQKSDCLDKTIEYYSHVVRYSISEWTTRAISMIGQAYEDYATGVFKQERPAGQSVNDMLSLELGIARAVDEYFVAKAVHYHEQNVMLAIKEKLEDKYILQSRTKLTQLPCMAGKNYLALVAVSQTIQGGGKAEGFAAIGKKLEMLQNVAPYQERAIELFLTTLEKGSRYQQTDEYYKEASELVTSTCFTVGETFADVARIAREAPLPKVITDPYERFIYKTKLLSQIQTYEDKALENFLKTIRISEAYAINDTNVQKTRSQISRLLFERGRAYELLTTELFSHPPFPAKATEAEQEEYRATFEEYGLEFQEKAFSMYRQILALVKENRASGKWVTDAYVRLYQSDPKQYGVKQDSMVTRIITSGPDWRCLADSVPPDWSELDLDDKAWHPCQRIFEPQKPLTGFPDKAPPPMWFGIGDPQDRSTFHPVDRLYLRYSFYNSQTPKDARLFIAAFDECTIYLNGKLIPQGSDVQTTPGAARLIDLAGLLREGKNTLAIEANNQIRVDYGVSPWLTYTVNTEIYLPQPPGAEGPLAIREVAKENYKFQEVIFCPVVDK